MKKLVIAAVLTAFAFEANANPQTTQQTQQPTVAQHLESQAKKADRKPCNYRDPLTGPWCNVIDRNVRKASVNTRYTVDRKIQRNVDKFLRKLERKL